IYACQRTDFSTGGGSDGDAGPDSAATADGSVDTGLDATSPDPDAEAGSCGDTTSDPENCGKCGHSCLGGQCVQAACSPVVIVTGAIQPRAVAVDSTYVYWAEAGNGNIRRAFLDGGSPQTVATTGGTVTAIAVDPDRVFWVDQTFVGVHLLTNVPSV